MRIEQVCTSLQYCRSGLGQQAPIDSIKPMNLAILVGNQGLPVEVALAEVPAEARGIGKSFAKFGSVNQQFLGDASYVHAGPAQVPLFGDRRFRAEGRGHPACPHATTAGPESKKIEI